MARQPTHQLRGMHHYLRMHPAPARAGMRRLPKNSRATDPNRRGGPLWAHHRSLLIKVCPRLNPSATRRIDSAPRFTLQQGVCREMCSVQTAWRHAAERRLDCDTGRRGVVARERQRRRARPLAITARKGAAAARVLHPRWWREWKGRCARRREGGGCKRPGSSGCRGAAGRDAAKLACCQQVPFAFEKCWHLGRQGGKSACRGGWGLGT